MEYVIPTIGLLLVAAILTWLLHAFDVIPD